MSFTSRTLHYLEFQRCPVVSVRYALLNNPCFCRQLSWLGKEKLRLQRLGHQRHKCNTKSAEGKGRYFWLAAATLTLSTHLTVGRDRCEVLCWGRVTCKLGCLDQDNFEWCTSVQVLMLASLHQDFTKGVERPRLCMLQEHLPRRNESSTNVSTSRPHAVQ